jgi:streptogramin lyase
MRRGPYFALLLVIAMGLVLTPAVPASARTTALPRYNGPAPGSVSCQFEAKVSFSRPLTTSGGAANPSKVKGRLGSCLSSDSAVNIRGGRITGSFASGFGTGCVWNGNQAATLTVSWRGKVDGSIGATTYGGTASFTPSILTYGGEQLLTNGSGDEGITLPGNTHGTTATGSFAGSSMDDRMATGFSSLTPRAITSACRQRRGVRSLTLTGAITVGVGIVSPSSITTGPDGALWASDIFGNDRITTSGAIRNFTDPSILSASGITAGPDGALWFTNPLGGAIDVDDGYGFAGTIGRLSTSGVLTTFSSPSISFPDGITAGPDGALWFTNSASNSIGRITTAGVVTNYSDPSVDASPTAIATGPDGALWFTNSGSNSIGRITTAGAVTIYTSLSINGPNAITAGPDGALWFTNDGDNTIGRITTSGVATSYSAPSINTPGGITTGPDGALWFTNGGSPPPTFNGSSFSFGGGSSSIGRITTSGVVTSYMAPSINSPGAITAGPDGALWFTDGETGLFSLGGDGLFSSGSSASIGRITTSGVVTNYG